MTQEIRIQNLKNGGPYNIKVAVSSFYKEEGDEEGEYKVDETHILTPGDECQFMIWDTRTVEIKETEDIE